MLDDYKIGNPKETALKKDKLPQLQSEATPENLESENLNLEK